MITGLLLAISNPTRANDDSVEFRVFAKKDQNEQTTGAIKITLPRGIWRVNKKTISAMTELKFGKIGSSGSRVLPGNCYVVYRIPVDGGRGEFKINTFVRSEVDAKKKIEGLEEARYEEISYECNDGSHSLTFTKEDLAQQGIHSLACPTAEAGSKTVYVGEIKPGIFKVASDSHTGTVNLRSSKKRPMSHIEKEDKLAAKILSTCAAKKTESGWRSKLTAKLSKLMASDAEDMYNVCLENWKADKDFCEREKRRHEICVGDGRDDHECATEWLRPNRLRDRSVGPPKA